MAEKEQYYDAEKGGFKSGNPGKQKGSKNKDQSRFRLSLARMRNLERKAVDNIEIVVNGGSLDKAVVDASKFVINTLTSLQKASLQEELAMKGQIAPEEPEEKEEEETKPRFSLYQIKTAEKELDK